MSQLNAEERAELLDLIKKEWDLNPDWSFGYLIKQYTYQAVGHTELFDEDDNPIYNDDLAQYIAEQIYM